MDRESHHARRSSLELKAIKVCGGILTSKYTQVWRDRQGRRQVRDEQVGMGGDGQGWWGTMSVGVRHGKMDREAGRHGMTDVEAGGRHGNEI